MRPSFGFDSNPHPSTSTVYCTSNYLQHVATRQQATHSPAACPAAIHQHLSPQTHITTTMALCKASRALPQIATILTVLLCTILSPVASFVVTSSRVRVRVTSTKHIPSLIDVHANKLPTRPFTPTGSGSPSIDSSTTLYMNFSPPDDNDTGGLKQGVVLLGEFVCFVASDLFHVPG